MSRNFEQVVYYMNGGKELSIQELKQFYKNIPGYILVVFLPEERNMIINNIESSQTGKEYGTHLFVHACNEAKKRGITTVTLDDCSDRYRQPHNIYTKLGMKYDEDGGPEMTGKVEEISNYKPTTKTPFIDTLVI